MSDAGSACTMLPPIVPRLRTWRSPMPPRALGDRRERRAGERLRVDELVPGRERADVELAVALLDTAQLQARDVDDERRPRDAELHHRDERLAARDRLRVRLTEELERVVEVGRARVARRSGDHEAAAAARIDSTMPW